MTPGVYIIVIYDVLFLYYAGIGIDPKQFQHSCVSRQLLEFQCSVLSAVPKEVSFETLYNSNLFCSINCLFGMWVLEHWNKYPCVCVCVCVP